MPSRTRATGPKTNRDPTRNEARRAHGNIKRDTDTNTAGHDRPIRTIPNPPHPQQPSITTEMSCMTPAHALRPDPRPVTRCVEAIFRACYGHSIVPNYADIVHKNQNPTFPPDQFQLRDIRGTRGTRRIRASPSRAIESMSQATINRHGNILHDPHPRSLAQSSTGNEVCGSN